MSRSEIIHYGIVLKNIPYGENDGIITILTEEGLVSFKARGILKTNSKNAASCLLYSESEFTLEESKNGHLILLKGIQKKSNYHIYESIDTMCCLGIVSDSIINFIDQPSNNIFTMFQEILNCVNQHFDIYTLTAIALAKIMIESGYGLNISSCVRCGSTKKIVSLDYNDGGFICQNCYKTNDSKEDIEYLKSVRYVFMVDKNNYRHYCLNKQICIRLIREFMNAFQDRFGLKKITFFELFDQNN